MGRLEHVAFEVVAVRTVAAFDNMGVNMEHLRWVDSQFLAVHNKLGLRAERDLYSAVLEELMLEKVARSDGYQFVPGADVGILG